MGNYTGNGILSIIINCNNNVYFSLLKIPPKVGRSYDQPPILNHILKKMQRSPAIGSVRSILFAFVMGVKHPK